MQRLLLIFTMKFTWQNGRSEGRNKLDGAIQTPKRELSRLNPESGEYEIIAEKITEVNQMVEEVYWVRLYALYQICLSITR
ncbi:MAG: hypothetical protein R2769_04175 [Saprospiraceae bacterium]